MRWIIIREAMRLARKVLGADDVWVVVPPRVSGQGEVSVFRSGDPSSPAVLMTYDIRGWGASPRVLLAMDGESSEVPLPRRKALSLRTGGKPIPPAEITLMRYGGAAIPMLANVVAAGHEVDLSGNPEAEGVLARFQAARAAPPPPPAPHRRVVTGKAKFKPHSQVRIKSDDDMKDERTAWIFDAPRRDARGKYWYLVRVDGSSEFVEYPENLLAPNRVGRISDA
jgi:hypothetical protein